MDNSGKMKIEIDKIVNYKIAIDKYYSDDIFSFYLDVPGLYEKSMELFTDKGTRFFQAIEKECSANDYDQIGDIESLMKLNMEHVYEADIYFTNGQNIISVLEYEEGYELGIHKSLNIFVKYFYDIPLFNQFSLSNLSLKKYEVLEKAELEIMQILSKLEIKRIPIQGKSSNGFLEIRETYPSTYFFTANNQTLIRKVEYYGKWIDKITEEVIESLKPLQVICCKNCKHFKFSGMSHDSTGGRTGYCFVVRGKLEEITVNESTTKIWNWCSKFEAKYTANR